MTRFARVFWYVFGSLLILVAPRFVPSPEANAQGNGGTPPVDCFTLLEIPGLDDYLPLGQSNGRDLMPGNSITVLCSWVDTEPGISTTTRTITVTIEPSGFRGSCINSEITGPSTFEDFTIEKAPNDPLWDVQLHPSGHYATEHGESATTKNPIMETDKIAIVLTSYDFGGRVTVRVQADGCPEVSEDIPLDTDDDALPDRWEDGKQFITPFGTTIEEYDIAAFSTAGIDSDGASDDDGGYDSVIPGPGQAPVPFPSKIHDEAGDGFSAFEEYRGLIIQGMHSRFEDLDNDAGLVLSKVDRATLMRDVFVHDPDTLLVRRNKFIITHGQTYHRIKALEMTTDVLLPQPPVLGIAGKVNPNGGDDQRAIWIREGTEEEFNEPERRGSFADNQGNKVNEQSQALPILLNISLIQDDTRRFKDPAGQMREHNFEDFRDWVVAHEMAHKMSLVHPKRDVALGRPSPRAFNNGIYWYTGRDAGVPTPTVRLWMTSETKLRLAPPPVAAVTTSLELMNPPAGANAIGPPDFQGGGGFFQGVHGDRHVAFVFQQLFGVPPVGNQSVNSHTGSLMDIVHEHLDLMAQDQLTLDERSQLTLKE